jgi:hypothetical protein
VRNKLIKRFLGQEVFEVEQEGGSLFVRDLGESVIRILSFQVDYQLGEFVVLSELFDGIRESVPADDG